MFKVGDRIIFVYKINKNNYKVKPEKCVIRYIKEGMSYHSGYCTQYQVVIGDTEDETQDCWWISDDVVNISLDKEYYRTFKLKQLLNN